MSELKTLFATVMIAATLAAGTIGAAAAGTTPSPAGKAYGFHAFFKKDITMKTHRGWLVVCANGHAQPWLRAAHAAKALEAAKSHRPAQAQGKSQGNPQGQSAAVTFTCP
ncbi:MAG TPA: hypothetical protein VE951_07020 [Candidatus Angelobacter sp.]|nr:hypothetical protein [Candidatus Angelobacter sp.]